MSTSTKLLLLVALVLALLLAVGNLPPASPDPPRTDDGETVRGGPSISAARVDAVLTAAHSPAAGLGPLVYQLSQTYQIDDAHALAFYHHESSYGTRGVAVLTHSWGNIRCTAGYACDPTGGYRAYPSIADGVRDWFALLASVYFSRGLTTVSQIIPVYAPAADHNNVAAYIHSVLSDVLSYRAAQA